MKKSARISDCGRYRWWLAREWNPDLPSITWIMANPSTADHEKDDNTVKRIEKFSKAWSYGSFHVVNLFPFRSSKPPECAKWFKTHEPKGAMYQNRAFVSQYISKSPIVLLAWGAAGDWDVKYSRSIIAEAISKAYCLGTITNGQPIHPSARGKRRISDLQQPIRFLGLRS